MVDKNSDDSELCLNDMFGHSGTYFDMQRVFSFEEAARALTYDKTKHFVPLLETALTPLGTLYHGWIKCLKSAMYEEDPQLLLEVSTYDNKTYFIQRDHLRNWCLRYNLKPTFLYPKNLSAPSLQIDGYDCPDELLVMMEAIKKFWVNADRSRPPKKDEEIIPWIHERVDSKKKAEAIDLLIRPEWARSGGNRTQSKG